MGPTISGRFLQRALNALNQGARDYHDLVVDGSCGQATRDALSALLTKRGKDGEAVILELLRDQQGTRYLELCEARVANEAFAFGWVRQRVCVA